jgi:alkaline phosphatase
MRLHPMHLASWRLRVRGLRLANGVLRIVLLVAAMVVGITAMARAVETPKNIILMISDGQGYNHVQAAEQYTGAPAVYESFGVKYGVSTYPLNYSSTPTGGHVAVGSYSSTSYWSSRSYPITGWTDSAAAATAMSTGVKSYNQSIDWDNDPAGTGTALKSIFEIARDNGKATGTISTVEWSHATPAAFGTHSANRLNYAQMANDMLGSGKVDVIMGAGNPDYNGNGVYIGPANTGAQYVGGVSTWNMLKTANTNHTTYNGFTPIFTKTEFENLANGIGPIPDKVVGTAQVSTTLQQARSGDGSVVNFNSFNTNVPSAATLAKAALNVLDQNPNGFFCMMETGGAVDWAAGTQKGRTIEEQVEFNNSVSAVQNWLTTTGHDKDTLLIVTADHETGFLWGSDAAFHIPGAATGYNNLDPSKTGDNVLGDMKFGISGGGHTNSLVPLFATGPGSELFAQYATNTDGVRGAYINNTDIFRVMSVMSVPEPSAIMMLLIGSTAITAVAWSKRR